MKRAVLFSVVITVDSEKALFIKVLSMYVRLEEKMDSTVKC